MHGLARIRTRLEVVTIATSEAGWYGECLEVIGDPAGVPRVVGRSCDVEKTTEPAVVYKANIAYVNLLLWKPERMSKSKGA